MRILEPRPRPWIPPEPLIFAQAMLLFSWAALFIAGMRGQFGASPIGLAWIHAVVLGWLTSTALAFLIHVLPEFTDVAWRMERLARGTLWIFQIGVVLLVAGFAAWIPLLPVVGGVVLVAAMVFYIVPFFATIGAAMQSSDRATQAVARALGIVVGVLALTVFVGFALTIGLKLGLPFVAPWARIHAMLGVFGWLSLIVAGVSVRTYNRLLGWADRRKPHIATSLLVLLGIAIGIIGLLTTTADLTTVGGALVATGAAIYLMSTVVSLKLASTPHRLPREFVTASAFWLAVALAYGVALLLGKDSLEGAFLFVLLVGWIGQNVNAHLMHVGVRLVATLTIADEDETEPIELLDRRAGIASLVFYQLAVACGVIALTASIAPLLETAAVFGIGGMAAMGVNILIAMREATRRRRSAA